MSSTTDVLMSFLGDLDSEPDFFFPEIDNEMDLNNFDPNNLNLRLHQRNKPSSDDISTLVHARVDNESPTGDSEGRSASSNSSTVESPGSSDYQSSNDSHIFRMNAKYPCKSIHDISEKDKPIRSKQRKRAREYDEDDELRCYDSLPERRQYGAAMRNSSMVNVSLNEESQTTTIKKKEKKKKGVEQVAKVKKNKLSAEEKMQTLVEILKNMRKTVEPPPPSTDIPVTPNGPVATTQVESASSMAEDFLMCIFSGKSQNGCTPLDLHTVVEPNGSLYIPAVASLFSLAQYKRSQSALSAWAPVNEGVEIFPERHTGVGQIAAASRCFARTLSDLITEKVYKQTQVSITVKRPAMSHKSQLIAPFVWKCTHSDKSIKDVEFSGLIRCHYGVSKFSFVHVSFDAFTIIRHCEQMLTEIRSTS